MRIAGTISTVLSFAAFLGVVVATGCSSRSNGGGPGGNSAGDDGGVPICYGGPCPGATSGDGSISLGNVGDANFGGGSNNYSHGNCSGGAHTTISGRVYDPAGANPLYNVTVYVPDATPTAFSDGVSCGSCSSLYTSVFASAVTDPNGMFKMGGGNMVNGVLNVDPPSGKGIQLVVQIGKWRKQYKVDVTACQDNPLPDKLLHLPKNASGDGDLPQIAISTGAADSLECLIRRMGVDASEYTGGAGGTGHIHIFSSTGNGAGGAVFKGGSPDPGMALWDKAGDIDPYDVVLLSCEGGETAHLNGTGQQVLYDYTGKGGRVFASHFHYAFFNTGPFAALNPPLANWTTGSNIDNDPIGGVLVTTLPNGMPFAQGAALQQWLGNVGALTGGKLPIHYGRDNAQVSGTNSHSQAWINADNTSAKPGWTQYFSFDTGSTDSTCGRVVYSDLHVSGGPMNSQDANTDYPSFNPGIVPDQCASHPLTPQEKALEFMIFNLSSCLVPPTSTPVPPTPQ